MSPNVAETAFLCHPFQGPVLTSFPIRNHLASIFALAGRLMHMDGAAASITWIRASL